MKVEVEAALSIKGLSEREGKSVVSSLRPDNVGLPESVVISLEASENEFRCTIAGELELGVFAHVWRDLMICLKTVISLRPLMWSQKSV